MDPQEKSHRFSKIKKKLWIVIIKYNEMYENNNDNSIILHAIHTHWQCLVKMYIDNHKLFAGNKRFYTPLVQHKYHNNLKQS